MNTIIPDFGVSVPCGYAWLLERGLINFEPFCGLQPWHYLKRDRILLVQERWPQGPSIRPLIVFAKRQDNDDMACFEVDSKCVVAVVIIHGWTSNGYDIVARYESFWDWVKAVVEDVREWCELAYNNNHPQANHKHDRKSCHGNK
ncbi:MAG: hypothetical protein LBL13_06200 [Bacteroidales bacterium]|jgi:hypothetical protein|nr:hypothetical protein [Bacteroidales bacterium]